MKRKFSVLLAVLLVLPLALPLLEADSASVPPDDSPRQTLSIVLNDETGDPDLSTALMEAIRVELRAKGWSNNKINRVLGSVNIDGAGEVLDLRDLSDWVVADHYDTAYYYATAPTLNNDANAATVNTFINNYLYKPEATAEINWYDVFGELDKNGAANGSKDSLRPYYPNAHPSTGGTGNAYLTGTAATALANERTLESWLPSPPYGHSTNVPVLASFDRHIMTRDGTFDGAKIDFVGYYNSRYIDYVYYPTDKTTTKHVWFDVDSSLINAHTLFGSGFMFNAGVSPAGYLQGYVMYFVYPDVGTGTVGLGDYPPTSLVLYKIKANITPQAFHEHMKASRTTGASSRPLLDNETGAVLERVSSVFVDLGTYTYGNTTTAIGTGNYYNSVGTSGTQLRKRDGTIANPKWWEKMSVEVQIKNDQLSVWTAPQGEKDLQTNPNAVQVINNVNVATGYYGFGPTTSYRSHACERATQVTFDNIVMEIEGEEANILQILEASTFNEKAEMYFIDLQSAAKPDRTNSAPQTDVFEDAAEFMKKKGSHFNYLTNQDNKFLDDGGLGAGELGQQGQTFRFSATAGGYEVTIMEDKIDPETGKVVRDPITGKAIKEPKTYPCGTLGEAIGKYIASRLGDCVDGIVYVIDEVNVPGIYKETGLPVGEDCVIELTQEEIYLPVKDPRNPTEDYVVTYYGLAKNGVTKWKAYKPPKPGKAGLFSTNDNTAFAKALAKGMTLSISNSPDPFPKGVKAPPEDTIITFAEIKKADLKANLFTGAAFPFGKLAVNYAIYADNEDYTFGEWTLTFKESLKKTFAKQDEATDEAFKELMAEVDNIKESVLIAPMDPEFKNKKILPGLSYGELCMFDGIPVKPMGEKNGKPKAIKSVYMVKTKPKLNDDGTYTAAGKPKKFSASSVQKAPKYKVNYKLENLKLKANDVFVVKKGEGFDDVEGLKTHNDEKGRLIIDDSGYRKIPTKDDVKKPRPLNLSDTPDGPELDDAKDPNSLRQVAVGAITKDYYLEIRKAATGKKPASEVQKLYFATRASLTDLLDVTLTVDPAKGKITTDMKPYEIYTVGSNGKAKWGGVPKVTGTGVTDFDIRIKATAKADKNDARGVKGLAASQTATLRITHDAGKVTAAEIVPKTP